MRKLILISLLLLFFFPQTIWGDTFKIDPAHTEVGFAVKHLVIANVNGAFKNFAGEYVTDSKNKLQEITVEVKAESIDTRINKRDDHLRSADFFDVVKFPEIIFKSDAIEFSQGKYLVNGDLKIKDVTKKITLVGEVNGPVTDPWGNSRIGVSFTGNINRKDFGLTYNKVLENGGLLIGDEVKISLEGEGILEK